MDLTKTVDYIKPMQELTALFYGEQKELMKPATEMAFEFAKEKKDPSGKEAEVKFRVFMIFYRQMEISKRWVAPDIYGTSLTSATTDELLEHARTLYKQLKAGEHR